MEDLRRPVQDHYGSVDHLRSRRRIEEELRDHIEIEYRLRREREELRRIKEYYRQIEHRLRRTAEEVEGLGRAIQGILEFNLYSNEKSLQGEDISSHIKKIIVLDDGEVCSVCLQDMNDGDQAGALKCSHIFHEKCVLEWANRKPNCPLCRHDVRKDRQQILKRKRLTYHIDEEVKLPKTRKRRLQKKYES